MFPERNTLFDCSQIDRKPPNIRCTPRLLIELSELVMEGYDRYPWGGAEVGGILFGILDSEGVYIHSYRPIECEHLHGPSFELSTKDLETLDQVLSNTGTARAQNDFVPVGWYHSVGRHGLSLTEHDRALHDRFFREPWQVALVLQRSRKEPVRIGFFCRERDGTIAPTTYSGSPVEDLQHPTEIAADPAPTMPEPEAQTIDTVGEPPSQRELIQDSFALTPDPSFFYASAHHKEALASLRYGIQAGKGFLALMGEAGTGKTMVLECLMEQLKAQPVEFAFIFNSKITPAQLFELLAYEFHLGCVQPTKVAVLVALSEFLVARCQAGQRTVLIVDNAQKLPIDVIEEIELLGNLETRREKLLQVIFAAQLTFERLLERPELHGLRQRIALRARLDRLDDSQTGEYIETRLAKAGRHHQTLFSRDLVQEIHSRTRGIPRLINAVCARMLALCSERSTETADIGMLDQVDGELELDQLRARLEPVLLSAGEAIRTQPKGAQAFRASNS